MLLDRSPLARKVALNVQTESTGRPGKVGQIRLMPGPDRICIDLYMRELLPHPADNFKGSLMIAMGIEIGCDENRRRVDLICHNGDSCDGPFSIFSSRRYITIGEPQKSNGGRCQAQHRSGAFRLCFTLQQKACLGKGN